MELSCRHCGDYQRIFQKYWKEELSSEELKTVLMDVTHNEIGVMRVTFGIQQTWTEAGIFGNPKKHYLLGKIRAKNQPTEEGWIFFGVMTANLVKLANKKAA